MPCWATDAASPWDRYSFSMCRCLKESSQLLDSYKNSEAWIPCRSENCLAFALIRSPVSLTLWDCAWRIQADSDVSIAGKTMWRGHLNESCVGSCACWQSCRPSFLIRDSVCCFKMGNWQEKCCKMNVWPFPSASFDSVKSNMLILSWSERFTHFGTWTSLLIFFDSLEIFFCACGSFLSALHIWPHIFVRWSSREAEYLQVIWLASLRVPSGFWAGLYMYEKRGATFSPAVYNCFTCR